MTIATTTNRAEYDGNGTTTAFSFPYYFPADGDLVVILVDTGGTATTQTITTHYTVAGAGDAAGGTVTMLTAPANGETLVIYRDPDQIQDLDLVTGDTLPATSLEAAYDYVTILIQRLQDQLNRTVKLPDSDISGADTALPAPVASYYIRWNSAANALEAVAADPSLAFDGDTDIVGDLSLSKASPAVKLRHTGGPHFQVINDGSWKVQIDAAGDGTYETTALKLDSNGNFTVNTDTLFVDATKNAVGVGNASLESWNTSYSPMQYGGNGTIFATKAQGASGSFNITQNAYYGTAWTYISNDEASLYVQQHGTHKWLVATSGTADTAITWTTALTIANNGGIYTPNATGGSQGADTINAKAVYDDGVLLTDYVFDKYFGEVSFEYSGAVQAKYDELNPALFDIDSFSAYWRENNRLPGMPDLNDVIDGVVKVGHGDLIQRLMQVVELQAIHIESLNQRLKAAGL